MKTIPVSIPVPTFSRTRAATKAVTSSVKEKRDVRKAKKETAKRVEAFMELIEAQNTAIALPPAQTA